MDVAIMLEDRDRADRLATLAADAAWLIQDVEEILRGAWPRLLVLDDTPHGLQCLDRIRNHPRTRHLPVVILSDDDPARFPDANACINGEPDSLASMLRFWTEISLSPRPT